MKRILIILSAMILLVSLIGCENKEVKNNDNHKEQDTIQSTVNNQEDVNENTKESNSINNSDNNNANTNSNKTEVSTDNTIDSQNTVKENNEDQKAFYGNWKVIKSIPTHGIYAEIDESEVIGVTMKFSNEEAVFGTHSIQNPKYQINNISIADFKGEFRQEPSELGISSNTITYTWISTSNGKDYLLGTFIVKDNDTLIYCVDGVYFEVKRES